MSSNTLLTPSIIAKEALAILKNNTILKGLVHTNYSNEFAKVGDTITIRIPATLSAADFTSTISSQNITESSVDVKLDRHKDVSVDLQPTELTLKIQDFSKQVIEPAMVAIGQAIDVDIANQLFTAASSAVLCSAEAQTTLANIFDLAKTLDIAKAPQGDRHLAMSPQHKYRYGKTTNLTNVSYAGDNEMLRKATLGDIAGFGTYMDQNMPSSTAATSGTATGTMKITATAAAETVACTVVETALGADGATLVTGDGFMYKGKAYRVTSTGTASSKEIASLAISPAFPDTISSALEVPIIRNTSSIAFHRNAVAFVNRPLEMPMGAARAAVDNFDGISVRVVYGYNQSTKTDTISFDVLYGLATLRSTLAVRLVDTF